VLYIGPGNRAAGQGENWQVYNNTVVNTKAVSGPAIAWSSTGGKELIFRNNAIQGFGSLWRSTTGITQSNNFLGSLGVVNFVPQSGSKLLNAGTATIKASAVSLANTCNATALSYCGTAPELGAVEAPATLR
jgi:hypothetical protein